MRAYIFGKHGGISDITKRGHLWEVILWGASKGDHLWGASKGGYLKGASKGGYLKGASHKITV